MTRVSIIIPFYNNEMYAKKCIDSVCKQTFRDLEIILINDGSTDGTQEILDCIKEQDSRIKVIHKVNEGVSVARNLGIDCATGDYFTFIDGDDYVSEKYIEELYNAAVESQADMVICGIKFVSEDGEVIQELIPNAYIKGEHEEWTFRISAACSHFYKKELWEKYSFRFSEGERAEDLPVALFFSAMADNILTIPFSGYYYVQHSQSARHQFRGLKNYDLPYKGITDSIGLISKYGIKNNPEFHELFILRILTTFFFELGIGSSRSKMKELKQFIYETLDTYYPTYIKNKKLSVFSDLDIPLFQKMAVYIFCILVKTKLIIPLSFMLSKN